MDVENLYTFIDGLCLPVHFLEFGNKFVPFPAPFSNISKLNEIVDITEKEQKPARISFKDFLKIPLLSEEPPKRSSPGSPRRSKRGRPDEKSNPMSETSIASTHKKASSPPPQKRRAVASPGGDMATLSSSSFDTLGETRAGSPTCEIDLCCGTSRSRGGSCNPGVGERPVRSHPDTNSKGKITFGSSEQCIDLNGKDVEDALKRLNSFFVEKNLRNLREVLASSRDEGELEIGIGIHLFKKLKGNATTKTLKAKRTCPCGCNERLNPNQNMWIGNKSTWYGELDILAGDPASDSSVAIMVKDFVAGDDNVEEEEEEISSSPGDRTNIEVKTNSDGKGFAQAASQSVVFAFTEYNRHEEKGCFIPTVLIDRYFYYIFLYSPVSDILVTTAVKYNFGPEFGEKSEFMRAILILWLVINHRIFFAKCPKLTEMKESGFSRKIQDLDKYKELKNFSYQLGAQPNTRSPQFVLGQSMLIYSNTAKTIELCDEIQSRIIQRPK